LAVSDLAVLAVPEAHKCNGEAGIGAGIGELCWPELRQPELYQPELYQRFRSFFCS